MAAMAINVLWFLIGLIVLAGVVWLAIWVVESFIYPIPERVKQGIWVIILILALIALITTLVGGGGNPFRIGKISDRSDAAFGHYATQNLQGVLNASSQSSPA